MTMYQPKKIVKTQVVELKLSGGMKCCFDSLEGKIDILPKRLNRVYRRIACYSCILAKMSKAVEVLR